MQYTFRFSSLASSLLLGFLLLSLSFLSGCGKAQEEKKQTPEEMLTKSWKLNKLDMQSNMMDPGIMANSSFTFYKNGRYEILLGELERGKWWLSPDKKVLITQGDGRPSPGEMDIVKLEPGLLVLTNNMAANPITFEWVPVQ
jgi:hypothetical protein